MANSASELSLEDKIDLEKVLPFALLLLLSPTFESRGQQFSNLAPQWGIAHSYIGVDGGGATVYDWNNDGWDDFVLVNNGAPCQFYQNTGNGFVLITPLIETNSHVKHLTFVDFDNDGNPDIFITCHLQPFELFRNLGNLQFENVTVQAGLPETYTRNFGHAWADIDRDGFLDLYVSTFSVDNDGKNLLFMNQGNGTFIEAGEALGVDDGYTFTLQPVFSDFNNDGIPDLFIANDKTSPNSLYAGTPSGIFQNLSQSSGIDVIIDAMSATAGDFDNDGMEDIYVTNNQSGNYFFHNNGDLTFTNMALESGVVSNRFGWGAQWLDFDNDGLRELFVATDLSGQGVSYRNHLFQNQGDGTFTDLSIFPMTTANFRSFSPAIGDFNNDGYPDILISNHQPHSSQLWINQGGNNHYLTIIPQGVVSNRDAVGVWITVQTGDVIQTHYTKLGEAYLAQNSRKVMFGLGQAGSVDMVSLFWPSGYTDYFFDITPNQILTVTEGSSFQAGIVPMIPEKSCLQPGDIKLTTTLSAPVLWNTGEFSDTLVVSSSGSYSFIHEFHPGLVFHSAQFPVEFPETIPYQTQTGHPSCYGDQNGWVSIYPETYSQWGDWNVYWNDGHQGLQHSNLTSGWHVFEVDFGNGCSKTDSVELINPDPLEAMILTFPSEYLNPGWATVDVIGGTPPYNIYWSDGQTGADTVYFQAGNHSVWVMDSAGCLIFYEVIISEILSITGESESQSPDVNLISNPCHDCRVNIQSLNSDLFVKIFDICGRTHATVVIPEAQPQTFNEMLDRLPSGVWILDLESHHFFKHFKLVKQ